MFVGEWVVKTEIKHTLDDHVDFFWRRSKLVGRGHEMFPNVEEITESMGAYRAALRYMEEHAVPCHCGGAVAVVCVADGGSPRTASLFATYLPQAVHSVDPAMHARYTEGDTVSPQLLAASKKGTLSAHACTIEEWVRHLPPPGPDLDSVCVVAGKALLTPARYSICEYEMTVELIVENIYQCIRTRYSRTMCRIFANTLRSRASSCWRSHVASSRYISIYKIHFATHCNTMQRTVLRCKKVQRIATRCNTLQHTLRSRAPYCWRSHVVSSSYISMHKKHTKKHHNTLQNTLQRTSTHCNTLQHTAPHCSTMRYIAAHYNALHRTETQTAEYCTTLLQYTASHGNTLQHTATRCSTLQHTAAHCNTLCGFTRYPAGNPMLQHAATRCNTLTREVFG